MMNQDSGGTNAPNGAENQDSGGTNAPNGARNQDRASTNAPHPRSPCPYVRASANPPNSAGHQGQRKRPRTTSTQPLSLHEGHQAPDR